MNKSMKLKFYRCLNLKKNIDLFSNLPSTEHVIGCSINCKYLTVTFYGIFRRVCVYTICNMYIVYSVYRYPKICLGH